MKIQTGSGSISVMTLVAVYSVSMVISLPGLAISPILGELEKVFTDASELKIQLLESLPSLIIVPFVLLSGRLSINGSKKKLLIIGLAIFFVSSVLCLFTKNLLFLLIISTSLGIGAGIVIPLSKGLIADFFTGRRRTAQLGISSGITNLSLVLATLLAGYLATIQWRYAFLVYCLSGIALALSYFLKDAPVQTHGDSSTTVKAQLAPVQPAPEKQKFKWPLSLMGLYFLATYLVLTVPFNLSIFMENLHVSSSTLAGLLIPCFFLAITAPGFFINQALALTRGKPVFYSMLVMGAGLLLFLFTKNVWLFGLGTILAGLGYGVIQPWVYDKTSSRVKADRATFNLSLVMSMNYIAILIYPFILEAFQFVFQSSSPRFPFAVNGILTILAAAFVFFKSHYKIIPRTLKGN